MIISKESLFLCHKLIQDKVNLMLLLNVLQRTIQYSRLTLMPFLLLTIILLPNYQNLPNYQILLTIKILLPFILHQILEGKT